MGEGSSWPAKLAAPQLEVWREAMAHLRHLSDDVWKGLRLFLTLHAIHLIIIAGTIALVPLSRRMGWVLAALSVIGMLLALSARFILKRHRFYYLEMLAKRALLEAELGFYETRLAGTETDLAFPWRLKPEVVAEIKRDCAAWIEKSVRAKGTIARIQFLIYETLLGLYGLSFFVGLARALTKN